MDQHDDRKADLTAGADDPEPIDLAPEPPQGAGSAPSWLGRVAVALLALGLVAGAVVLAQDGGDEGAGGGAPRPLPIGGASGVEVAAADLAYGTVRYELAGPLPDLGDEAPVHRLVRPEVTTERWAEMARGAGVAAEPAPTPAGAVAADDGERVFVAAPIPGGWQVSVSRAFEAVATTVEEPAAAGADRAPVEVDPISGTSMTAAPPPDAGAPVVEEPAGEAPTADEAEAAAREVLAAMGVLDDLGGDVQVEPGAQRFTAVGCAIAGDGTVQEECPTWSSGETATTEWLVVFPRLVDDRPVRGLEWSVEVAGGGDVQHVVGVLADVEELGPYPLRSTQSAYDELTAASAAEDGPLPVPPGDTSAAGATVPPVPTGADIDEACPPDGTCVTPGSPGEGSPDAPRPSPCPPTANCVVEVPPACGDPAVDCPATTAPCVPGPAADCFGATTIPCVPGPAVDCGPVDVTPCASGPAVDCATVATVCDGDPSDGCDDPPPVPEPAAVETVVTVTGAELTAALAVGIEDGVEVTFLVPHYRFVGTSGDGVEWSHDVLAVADDLVVPPGSLDEPVTDATTVTTVLTPDTTDQLCETVEPYVTEDGTEVETFAHPCEGDRPVPDPPTCSNEHPEACAGSLPTTSAPAPAPGGTPSGCGEPVPVTNPNGVVIGTEQSCEASSGPATATTVVGDAP